MCTENVKKKYHKLVFIVVPVVLLVATVAVSIMMTEDAFAKVGRYTGDSTSQAAAVSNECLNPIFDSNTIDNAVVVGNCGGTVSQQDESGQAGVTTNHQDANPTIELQRSTTTQPPGPGTGDCEGCFASLSEQQVTDFLVIDYNMRLQANGLEQYSATTIQELCNTLNSLKANGPQQDFSEVAGIVSGALESSVGFETASTIVTCLNNIFGSGTFPPP
jgi:hypothetical protein